MNKLDEMKCTVCQAGAPQLKDEEIAGLILQIPGWEVKEENNIKKISRKVKLKNFKETLSLVNKIGAIAQEQGHHPELFISYNYITIWLWTHKIKGLHENDFIMAARINKLIK